MGRQQLLDLGREHVLAAGHDHVVVAAVDEQAAVGVEVPEVAARQQPVDLLLAATAGVAVEAGAAADEDAPDDARSAPARRRASRIRTVLPGATLPAVDGAACRSPGPAIVASETSVEP